MFKSSSSIVSRSIANSFTALNSLAGEEKLRSASLMLFMEWVRRVRKEDASARVSKALPSADSFSNTTCQVNRRATVSSDVWLEVVIPNTAGTAPAPSSALPKWASTLARWSIWSRSCCDAGATRSEPRTSLPSPSYSAPTSCAHARARAPYWPQRLRRAFHPRAETDDSRARLCPYPPRRKSASRHQVGAPAIRRKASA